MPKTSAESLEEKLDTIIAYMQRMDKRDRVRMWGGFVRSLISLIPMILFVWSTWYFFVHGDELMQKITKYAAQSAASMTTSSSADLMDQFQLLFPGGN